MLTFPCLSAPYGGMVPGSHTCPGILHLPLEMKQSSAGSRGYKQPHKINKKHFPPSHFLKSPLLLPQPILRGSWKCSSLKERGLLETLERAHFCIFLFSFSPLPSFLLLCSCCPWLRRHFRYLMHEASPGDQKHSNLGFCH